jgi:hypothetical protein
LLPSSFDITWVESSVISFNAKFLRINFIAFGDKSFACINDIASTSFANLIDLKPDADKASRIAIGFSDKRCFW